MRQKTESEHRAFVAVLAAATLLFQVLSATIAQAQVTSVTGIILNNAGMPVPGVRVVLINPPVNFTASSVTNMEGIYLLTMVPFYVQAPYVLQVYWGSQLVYQIYLTRLGEQEPIRLHY